MERGFEALSTDDRKVLVLRDLERCGIASAPRRSLRPMCKAV